MALRSSWGLAVDLGDQTLPEGTAAHLYQGFWSQAGTDPLFKMGDYGDGIPQAAEGKVTLVQGEASLTGKAYTKFERDAIGYPPGWEVPTLFSLSLFGFVEPLPESEALREVLIQFLEKQIETLTFRMAVIGNLGCYYLNAEMINAAWVTMQQQDIHTLILHRSHPLTRQLQGEDFGAAHMLFTPDVLQTLWQPELDFEVRHKAYKAAISTQLHTELLPLEWE